MSCKDTDKECAIHSKSDGIEIMITVDELIGELFQSLLSIILSWKYQRKVVTLSLIVFVHL